MDKKYRKKTIFALFFNIFIVFFEILGVIFSVQRHGIKVFMFYTENSNYLSLLISLSFCIYAIIYLKSNRSIPYFIYCLRFISTTCLTITLFVVLFILTPMLPGSFVFMMFKSSNLFQHLLCPVFSIISFLFFENSIFLNKKALFYALIPTIIYGIICIGLNLLKIITGPYPFFYVYLVPWWFSSCSILVIIMGSLGISFLLYKLFNKPHSNIIKYQNNTNLYK